MSPPLLAALCVFATSQTATRRVTKGGLGGSVWPMCRQGIPKTLAGMSADCGARRIAVSGRCV